MNHDNFSLTNTALEQLRIAVNDAILAETKTQQDYFQTVSSLNKAKEKYHQALESGSQDLINSAKFQRDRLREVANRLKPLLVQQDTVVKELKTKLLNWEQKLCNASIEISTQIEASTAKAISCSNSSREHFPNKVKKIEQEIASLRQEVFSKTRQQTSCQEQLYEAEKELKKWQKRREFASEAKQTDLALAALSREHKVTQQIEQLEMNLEKYQSEIRKNSLILVELEERLIDEELESMKREMFEYEEYSKTQDPIYESTSHINSFKSKSNLLEKIIEALKESNKSSQDVLWVGIYWIEEDDSWEYTSWQIFEELAANITYEEEAFNISPTLVIVGEGWWLERGDDCENWKLYSVPCKNSELVTVSQGDLLFL